jgi:hypothetical protein
MPPVWRGLPPNPLLGGLLLPAVPTALLGASNTVEDDEVAAPFPFPIPFPLALPFPFPIPFPLALVLVLGLGLVGPSIQLVAAVLLKGGVGNVRPVLAAAAPPPLLPAAAKRGARSLSPVAVLFLPTFACVGAPLLLLLVPAGNNALSLRSHPITRPEAWNIGLVPYPLAAVVYL